MTTKKSATEITREEGLDKFYTIPTISEKCLRTVERHYTWSSWGLVIEPSAGNGSFYERIPIECKVGIDISPEHEDIITYILIGIGIGVGIGFVLKAFLDTYAIIERLPI